MATEKHLSAVQDELRGSKIRHTFFYPHQVVRDRHLTLAEKQQILTTWGSDRHAVDSMPTLRHMPGTPFPVTYSSIMDAWAELDRICGLKVEPDGFPPTPRPVRARRPRPAIRVEAA